MKSVAEKISLQKHIRLNQTQYIAFEIICSSYMLNLLNESSTKNSYNASSFVTNKEELNEEAASSIKAKLKKIQESWCKRSTTCVCYRPGRSR